MAAQGNIFSFRPVFYINGILLLILSATMLLPVLIDLAHNSPDWRVFAASQIVTAFVGFALIFTNHEKKNTLNLRQTFVLTTLSWFFLTGFAALPFFFAQENLGYAAAFFEAMSGLTTTGSTVLAGLDELPKGILFWRAMLQWLGGIGFLIIALAILPLLQVSGMQIFKTQSFGMEKVLPSASQMAVYIFMIYIVLTLSCTMFYYIADMSFFDAIAHAMSTVSTGGFSTYDSSIGYFNSRLIDVICIVFMILGALPFVLYMRMMKGGDNRALIDDSQVRTFMSLLGVFTAVIAFYLMFTGQYGFFDSLINAGFMMTTLMTTTGFTGKDYTVWGSLAIGIAFAAMYMGACSGSTSGGIKTFRLQILWAMVQQQIRRLIVPHGVFHVHYSGKVVDPTVQTSVAVFFFVHIMTWLFITILLHLTGMDFTTAVSGAISSVSNIGPGLGHMIGPSGTFAALPEPALWVLSIAMMMGRMEFLTLFVLLTPRFWRG